MGVFKDMFSSPKLPKVPPAAEAAPPVENNSVALGQASEDARKAARRRLGMLSLVYTGNPATGLTGAPRTAAGGLTGVA